MKEEEIRPQHIFNEYLRLCKIDCLNYFSKSPKVEINCPACNTKGDYSFQKDDFIYEVCNKCSTLYVSPRPHESVFNKFYLEAPSVKYWASTFYKETAEARRKKMWKPKVSMVLDLIKKYNLQNYNLVDIGAGFGIFCEELNCVSNMLITAIEPEPELTKACQNKGIKVIQKFLQDVVIKDLDEGPQVFVSFELFEHLQNPNLFLTSLFDLMRPGDFFIFTTLSGVGVDIQVLWEKSKSVSPPHHLNFFNPLSIKILLSKVGFKVLEVSTPGKLDIDILVNNYDLIKDKFWRTLLKHSTEDDRKDWQSFISKSGQSSHMMVCCQKQ
jgi:2-polyprenyl-3-methyl-5-hydroxy-6-metoxy-1,4-benzoquinol methylase